jgi:hypothetical protein
MLTHHHASWLKSAVSKMQTRPPSFQMRARGEQQRHDDTMTSGRAEVDLSEVCALGNRAHTLLFEGRFARAADAFAAAVAAARALDADDSLVAASLQLSRADTLLALVSEGGLAPDEATATRQLAYAQLLPAVMGVVQRRAAARSLLPGACRAHEEAWERARLVHTTKLYHAGDAAEQASAPFVGYTAFLLAADLALNWIVNEAAPSARALSSELFPLAQERMTFVCDALRLMA